ncbi:unnamed protein product [Anisakis simplex]|uniref:Uncharacterized protein n=1 Tax=Anisakis simplex TaxID=6269 RepID=A0A0M3JVT0_ANISI|nr:unnamed protein product [Anisakis simplex]
MKNQMLKKDETYNEIRIPERSSNNQESETNQSANQLTGRAIQFGWKLMLLITVMMLMLMMIVFSAESTAT